MTAQSAPDAPHLLINDQPVAVQPGEACMSLLDYLRDVRGLKGTKEGCASGDCGACTVLVEQGSEAFTRNSCITPVLSVLGTRVVTVEGVGTPRELHPVQQAMVDCHGSQCGFCTPGFVVSMAGFQRVMQVAGLNPAAADRDTLVRAISGNLCRCTGYRPILAAFEQANAEVTAAGSQAPTAREFRTPPAGVHQPETLSELRALLGKGFPLVAGATDLWLEVSQQLRDFDGLVDLSRIDALATIEISGTNVWLGAGATHAALETVFANRLVCEDVVRLLHRFGSPQIRSRGTLGGNVANASPVADWPPVLLIAEATVVLENAQGQARRVPLASFYTGYRQTLLEADEYVLGFSLDATMDWSQVMVEKISKRWEDDISSVLGAFYLRLRNGHFDVCRVAYGGVAGTPVRLRAVEAALLDKPDNPVTAAAAEAALRGELTPISDARASAAYRLDTAVELLHMAIQRARQGRGTPQLGDVE